MIFSLLLFYFILLAYFILIIIFCFIILFSRYNCPRETNPPHARRSRNDTSMFPWNESTARQIETRRPANPQKPANHTRCALKSRRTERAAHWNRDEPRTLRTEIKANRTCCALKSRRTERAAHRYRDKPHYPPLRGPGHKKALPIAILAELFTAGVSYQLMGKTCTSNHAGKTKNQIRPLQTYRTYPPDARLEWGWAGGKSSQSQNTELSMQVREPRMDDNCAGPADNLRKFS